MAVPAGWTSLSDTSPDAADRHHETTVYPAFGTVVLNKNPLPLRRSTINNPFSVRRNNIDGGRIFCCILSKS